MANIGGKLREFSLALLVLALLVAVVGFGWMTRQPAHPTFDRLAEVPIAGAVFRELRRPHLDAYKARLATESRLVSAGSPRPNSVAGEDRSEFPSASGTEANRDFEWIGIGATLYSERAGQAIGKTRSLASYEVLERDGTWLHLALFDRTRAWVNRAEARDLTPPLGDAPIPPGPLPSRPASAERLEQALASTPRATRDSTLAGYRLLTDLGLVETPLFEILEQSLSTIEAEYRSTYGLSPQGTPRETIVLYRDAESYRRLQSATEGLASFRSTGHTSGGLIALAKGDRDLWEIEATLVHEVTHLLNRRALGPVLPPWLSEGLATHLAQLARTENPEADPQLTTIGEEQITYHGPHASLRVLSERAARGALLGLQGLTSVQEEQFRESPAAALLYAQAGYLVEFLLESPDLRLKFLRFLEDVAGGESASGDRLRQVLAIAWEQLDSRFSTWIQTRSERIRAVGLSSRAEQSG